MAYMEVPKDLEKVKTKIALGLTKRQIIGFGSAALVGIPIYFITRKILPSDIAMVALFVAAAPMILMALYEKDGIPAEEILKSYLKYKFLRSPVRKYKVTKQNAFLKKGVQKRGNRNKTIETTKESENVKESFG